MTDPADMATGGVLGIFATFISTLGVQAFKGRRTARRAAAKEHQADATVEVAGIEAIGALAQKALDRVGAQDEAIEALRQEVRKCESERAEDRERYAQQRAEDQRRCDKEQAAIRRELRRVAAQAADTRAATHGDDDTGVHRLRRIASGSRPEIPAMSALKDV